MTSHQDELMNVEKWLLKMPQRKRVSPLYGGGASKLNEDEPCTYRELINYYYFLKVQGHNEHDCTICKMISNKIKSVWKMVHPALPLLSDNVIQLRTLRVIKEMKGIKAKTVSPKIKKNMYLKLDKLFDISSCKCDLPDKQPCDDRYYILDIYLLLVYLATTAS